MTAFLSAAWLLFKGFFTGAIKVFSWVPWWLYLAALLFAAWAWNDLRVENGRVRAAWASAEQLLKVERADRAIERDQAQLAAIAALTERESINKQLMRAKENADAERIAIQDRNARYVASLRRELDGVQRALETYASGGRPSGDDSVADCRRRADALGGLLAEALRAAADLAGDAEREAADARALRQAWPVIQEP